MTVFEVHTKTGLQFRMRCRCGWETPDRYTVEGAGRDMDLHMAEKFPLPTSRRECYAPVPYTLESRVQEWVISRLGEDHMYSPERAMRLFEETAELVQAEGIDRDAAHRQVDYVYSRPPGVPVQEAGGVAVCLLAWCAANAVLLIPLAVAEIERIEAKPVDEIRGSVSRKRDMDLVTILPRRPE